MHLSSTLARSLTESETGLHSTRLAAILNGQVLYVLRIEVVEVLEAIHENISEEDLPNFHMVVPGILRGGQPSDEGYACLKKLDVRTIINLRDERLFVRSEELAVLSLGMNYVNVSLSPFIEPTPEQIERCLSVMTDENQMPVFVHCLHGMDRTGTIIAAYRVAVEGWSLPRAYVEMLSRGFHPEFSNLTRALEAFCTDRDGTPMDLHI